MSPRANCQHEVPGSGAGLSERLLMKARLSRRSHVFYAMTVIAGLALLAASRGGAQAEVAPRYPFDPLCPWGRISDGHGMLVRCLAPAEATALVQGPQASAPLAEPA